MTMPGIDATETADSRFRRLLPPLALCGLWVAMALAVNPVGDFPLNDDWGFGLPVEVLLRQRTIYFTGWQAMTLIGQVLWGALFCLPAGYSYTALRISTLVMGLIGVLSLYGLLLEVGARRAAAFVAATTVAVNPLYLGLSATFMTDIPFLATMIAGLLFVVRGLRRESTAALVSGSLILLYCMFIRQIGLVVFAALTFATLVKWGFTARWLLLGVLPTALAGSSLKAYNAALRSTGRLPRLYEGKSDALFTLLNDVIHARLGALKYPLSGSFIILMYVGLSALPFLVLLWPSALRPLSRGARNLTVGAVLVATLAVAGALSAFNALMPLTENIVIDFGQGIRPLRGAAPPGAPRELLLAVTAASVLGAVSLILLLAVVVRATWTQIRRPSDRGMALAPWLLVLLGASALLYTAPIISMYQALFDRYTLPVLVLLIAAVAGVMGRARLEAGPIAWTVFGITLLAEAYFSVGSTHDLLDWNRARWAACHELIDRDRLALEDVDGGFEFNNYVPTRALIQSGKANDLDLIDRSEAPYVVAMGPIAGYEVVKRFPCRPWLPRAIPEILVLKRGLGIARSTGRG